MKKDNQYLANKLYEYADLLEAVGDNPYKIRAYRRAVPTIQKLEENIYTTNFLDLTDLPGIGKGIAYIIQYLVNNDSFPEVKSVLQKNINELLDVPGLGPKRVQHLHEHYQIYTKKALLKAIQDNQLNKFSPKLLNQIKEHLKNPKKKNAFLRLYHSLNIVKTLESATKKIPGVELVLCCGDYRRKREIVEHFVLIIKCSNPAVVLEHVSNMPFVKYILSSDTDKLKVQLSTGIAMDIYCVKQAELGAAMLFHTGSEAHFAQLVQHAEKNEFVLSEKGLFKNAQCFSTNEAEIYHELNLNFIEPVLREGRGEIEAAVVGNLPKLIQLEDIKGDLHVHTNESDGREPLEVMVQTAAEQGYAYVAITDHSQSLTIAHGLDEQRVLQQIKQIDKLNSRLNNILILKSIEVDILEDGSLDLSNDVLKELDIVVCSIHSKFKLGEKKQTERILRAMDNPYFNILGHATGRLIKSRPPYPIDLERILKAAKDRNCFMELNAQPYRLDINEIYCKMAKDMGVKVAISSDAHTVRGFNFMQLGIYQAQRGWLEKNDVLNTRSWPELKKLLRK